MWEKRKEIYVNFQAICIWASTQNVLLKVIANIACTCMEDTEIHDIQMGGRYVDNTLGSAKK